MAIRKGIRGMLAISLVLAYGREVWASCEDEVTGYTCVCNSDDSKRVCAKKSGSLPIVPDDIAVNYSCDGCSDAPKVEIKAGDTQWELYSEVVSGGAAASLGDVLLAPSGSTNNFEVSIKKGSADGAVNVKSINLTATSWTGYSSLEGGSISGNLNGILEVKKNSSGTGGLISNFTVDGDVTGPVTAAKVTSTVHLSGDVAQNIDLERIEDGALLIDGDISANITIRDKLLDGNLQVQGLVPSTSDITVNNMDDGGGGAGLVFGVVEPSASDDFAGDLILTNGVSDTGAYVSMRGVLTGKITLNGEDVIGLISLERGGTGDITNGGDLSGTVTLGLGDVYSGDVDFDSVSSGGEINVIDADLAGDIAIGGDMDGVVTVDGELDDAASLVIDGVLNGTIDVYAETEPLSLIHVLEGVGSGGKILINTSQACFCSSRGNIQVGPFSTATPLPAVEFDGCLRIYDDSSNGNGGDLKGRMQVVGCHDDTNLLNLCTDGDISGTFSIVQTNCSNQVSSPYYTCSGCP